MGSLGAAVAARREGASLLSLLVEEAVSLVVADSLVVEEESSLVVEEASLEVAVSVVMDSEDSVVVEAVSEAVWVSVVVASADDVGAGEKILSASQEPSIAGSSSVLRKHSPPSDSLVAGS